MKYLLVIFSLFLSVQVNAQKATTVESAIKINDTLQPYVEKLYAKMILSDSYQESEEVRRIYFIQIHFLTYQEELLSSGNFNSWVHKNLEKTEFKTTAEADEAYNKFNDAMTICSKEHKDYTELLPQLLATEEGMKVWKRAIVAVAERYPDKFRKAPLSRLVKMY